MSHKQTEENERKEKVNKKLLIYEENKLNLFFSGFRENFKFIKMLIGVALETSLTYLSK